MEKSKNISKEKKLQSECIVAFHDKYPHKRGDIFATFQETLSPVQGSIMKSLGLLRGVSDLIYIPDVTGIIGIEIKYPGERHKVVHVLEQSIFLVNKCKQGWFCNSVEMFMDIIDNKNGGIMPEDAIERCMTSMKKKVALIGNETNKQLLQLAKTWESRNNKRSIGTVIF